MKQTDWIVVGAGTAGCMIASRLATPDHAISHAPDVLRAGSRRFATGSPTVTVIEPESKEAPASNRMRPARWLRLLGSGEDWNLRTEASTGLANRVMTWPRGRGLGGSSRINAMIWFPPAAEDFEMISEMTGGTPNLNAWKSALSQVRSIVQPELPHWLSEPSRRFMDALRGSSWGEAQVYQRFNQTARRWSADQLLDAGLASDSIQLFRSTVNRLVWENDRVVGVEVHHKGQSQTVLAKHGVVLAAGAIATPAILMRSGIGPPEVLQQHNIEVRSSVPAIGRHLRDHLIMPVIFRCRSGGLCSTTSPRDLIRWQALGTGPLASNVAECGGLFGDRRFQMHVTPTHYLTYPKPTDESHMTLGVNLTQPQSEGHLAVTSTDPFVSPRIIANYLDAETDRIQLCEAVEFARQIARDTPLSDFVDVEVLPGSRRSSREAVAKAITRYAQTLYHPIGTCRMGTTSDCPVTADFALRRTSGLWIVDGSLLPRLTVGNPSATILLLSYHAATIIRERA